MQRVPLPHWPFVVMRPRGTVGPVPALVVGGVMLVVGVTLTTGGREVVVTTGGRDTMAVEMDVEEVEVVVGGAGIEVVVGGGGGAEVVAGRGHPQTPYCGWQSKRGAQWSTESPQKP